jgi:peptidoglycan/xylan/chitin deacetylase (PgdA/CDA1 family)
MAIGTSFSPGIQVKNKNKAFFVMSLDVELAWGFTLLSRSPVLRALNKDPEHGRGSIAFLLHILEKYNIPATWAIVGHLFLDHCEKDGGKQHQPVSRSSDDVYARDPCTDISRDPLYYGKDFVDKILVNPVKHEIGYHSFSHVSFDKCDSKVAEFEIIEGLKLAGAMGINLNSFVFPKGDIGNLDTLKKHGFTSYRPTPTIRGAPNQNFILLNYNRVLDRILPPPLSPPKWQDGIWEIPASMDFYDFPPLQPLLLPRAKRGIRQAVKKAGIFHLTLHPDRLVAYPSLRNKLECLLGLVAKKRQEGDLEVTTMRGIISHLNSMTN